MVYDKKIAEEWGTEVYPQVLRPTMKELQLSKGAIWKNTLRRRLEMWHDKQWVVERSDIADRMLRKTGIRPKGTHYKMDLGFKKVGLGEVLVIRAKDDNSLNDYTRRVELMAIPLKNAKKTK